MLIYNDHAFRGLPLDVLGWTPIRGNNSVNTVILKFCSAWIVFKQSNCILSTTPFQI